MQKGIGTRLIDVVKKEIKRYGVKKIKVRTSNDNLYALRFYQKREFRLVKIYRGAVIKSRKIKQNIPLTGKNGIPLRDEIELEFKEL